MFDKACLRAALTQYKKIFVSFEWEKEKYKWEAVKCFQDNWDINAPDFAGMLERSLAKTKNLLVSVNHFPAAMIIGFANSAPEEVRSMFIALFDESVDVYARIKAFKEKSPGLLARYGNGAKSHYQTENPISVYLWLRYPDKYYIYKYSELKTVAEKLKCDFQFKKGAYASNIRNFYKFYDEICEEIRTDAELVNLYHGQLEASEACYPDPELRTLTADVGFYISRYYALADANLGLKKEDWLTLLKDSEVFTEQSLEIMKRFKDCGGEATYAQLAEKYGETKDFYGTGSIQLARRITAKKGCTVVEDKLPEVLYLAADATQGEEEDRVWKLRSELADALEAFDLSGIKLYAGGGPIVETHGYWWLNANPRIWSFSSLEVGKEQVFTLYNENGNKRRIFKNFLDAKVGDKVICYESTPVKQIVALGRVSVEHDEEKLSIEKLEGLASPIDYDRFKDCAELAGTEFRNQQGSLFKLSKEEFDFLMDLIREDNPIQTVAAEKYDKAAFLKDVYMSEEQYDRLSSLVLNKKNVILQGAPGVGKTFAAKRLAYAMMGQKDDSRVKLVQFHQNYSYEDFMMGYKPYEDGFKLQYGVFYRFCQEAANHPDKDYFFIIDEINRGNLSRIFGELLMLIERDYRDTKVTLPYNGQAFSVPRNLYLIGMMNTADRSLAMIDYALRRRFSFFTMGPAFNEDGFRKYQEGLGSETLNKLIEKVEELNEEISKDKSLGKGFVIGHSYFCGKDECTDAWLKEVVDFDILPMLEEYWFDDPEKVKKWQKDLLGVFDD